MLVRGLLIGGLGGWGTWCGKGEMRRREGGGGGGGG